MSDLVEIYVLIDPRDDRVRYVGKANDAQKRLKAHLRECRRDTPVYRWIKKLRLLGLIPKLGVVCRCHRDEWQWRERLAISKLRERGAKILNVADGGDEPYCPPEVRVRNAKAQAVARQNNPFKNRIFKLKMQIGIALRDGYITESAKEKLRYAAAKRPDLFGSWSAI